MTFRCSPQEGMAEGATSDSAKVEVLCAAATKKLWCSLRDTGNFLSDSHFLIHLLHLEQLWQEKRLEPVNHSMVSRESKYSEQMQNCYASWPVLIGNNSSATSSQLSSQILSSLIHERSPPVERIANERNIPVPYIEGQTNNNIASINDRDFTASLDCRQTPVPFVDPVITASQGNDACISHQGYDNVQKDFVVHHNHRPLEVQSFESNHLEPQEQIALQQPAANPSAILAHSPRYVHTEPTLISSESGDEYHNEDSDMYTVEIDIDKNYPSLHIEDEKKLNRKITEEEEEVLELRRRPLRKRLKRIVELEEADRHYQEEKNKAAAAVPESISEKPSEEINNDEFKTDIVKSESPTNDLPIEEHNKNGKKSFVKRWTTRKLPPAASAYMKVMKISERISPDRRAVPSTNNLLMLKAPKPTNSKENNSSDVDSSQDSSQNQLAELVYCQGSREIQCPVCSHTVPLKKDFLTHLENHVHLGSSSCPVCNSKFRSHDSLLQHLQTHAEKTYKCDKCTSRFSNRHRLNVHFFEHLTEAAKDDFRCDICGKPCYSKCYLQRHRRRHTGERPYMCDVCGKVYYEMSTLNTHRRSHTDERFTCEICGNRYMQKSALNLHMKSAHEGIKEHMCEMCGKAFFDKHHLQKHIRIHTGEKPYQCDFCGKSFTQKVNRDQHRRLHTGEQPYRCEYCMRSFALRAAYTQHVRKHTGVKVSEMKRVQLEKLQQEWNDRHKIKISPGPTVN